MSNCPVDRLSSISKSNIADIPSRGEINDLLAVKAKHEQVEPIEILRKVGPVV